MLAGSGIVLVVLVMIVAHRWGCHIHRALRHSVPLVFACGVAVHHDLDDTVAEFGRCDAHVHRLPLL